jgi:hypothetical protein
MYIVAAHPFKNKINQLYMLLNEILTLIFYLYLGAQYYFMSGIDQKIQGMNCIFIVGTALGLNAFFGLLSGFYSCHQRFRKKVNNMASVKPDNHIQDTSL